LIVGNPPAGVPKKFDFTVSGNGLKEARNKARKGTLDKIKKDFNTEPDPANPDPNKQWNIKHCHCIPY
jgi:hypothetical protein